MSFCGGVIIKLKVKGYLKNITEKTEEKIDTTAIKKTNEISYIIDDTKYKLIVEKTKITLIRENKEFSHRMIFEHKKQIISEYYLKELHSSLEFNILTTSLLITENKINITYQVIESKSIYNYVLEMSGN